MEVFIVSAVHGAILAAVVYKWLKDRKVKKEAIAALADIVPKYAITKRKMQEVSRAVAVIIHEDYDGEVEVDVSDAVNTTGAVGIDVATSPDGNATIKLTKIEDLQADENRLQALADMFGSN